jgi:sodium transport system permease protein
MTFRRRVATIYRKELIDILRDRRTLIAMIVVPIVLYPLLMLGSIQAVTHQAVSMEEEGFVIGVLSKHDSAFLERLIQLDERALNVEHERERIEADRRGEPPPPRAIPANAWEKVRVAVVPDEAELEERVQDRSIQVGVVFRHIAAVDQPDEQTLVEFFVDEEEIRSDNARDRLRALLSRTDERITADRISGAGLPPTFAEPIITISRNLSAPSSILGQILPLILVLMTITGAIYPAIDLTAGERERNTLESLMVCPVPVLDLIVGKFLVVTTVAIMGATLNLSSVTATVYLGGFKEVIASGGGTIPFVKMLAILVSLIPFAVLMSAIMIAVCSYARTFKEAQNYVTPVIIAVLIPGGIAALPATRLEGMMLIMPVGNMVLFARDMLLGADVAAWKTLSVIISTTLYASAAVAIAASVFGRESVVFSDAGSLKATFSRRLFRPTAVPKVSMALLLVALLFPTWFFVQTALQPKPGGGAAELLYGTGMAMPLLFVMLPWVVLIYWKVSPRETFALRAPAALHLLAGILLGLSTWILAHEFSLLQNAVFPRAPRGGGQ